MESENNSQEGDYLKHKNKRKNSYITRNEEAYKHMDKLKPTYNNILVGHVPKSLGLCGIFLLYNGKTESILRTYNLAFLLPIGFLIYLILFFGSI